MAIEKETRARGSQVVTPAQGMLLTPVIIPHPQPLTAFLCDLIRVQLGKLSIGDVQHDWRRGRYSGVSPQHRDGYLRLMGFGQATRKAMTMDEQNTGEGMAFHGSEAILSHPDAS